MDKTSKPHPDTLLIRKIAKLIPGKYLNDFPLLNEDCAVNQVHQEIQAVFGNNNRPSFFFDLDNLLA